VYTSKSNLYEHPQSECYEFDQTSGRIIRYVVHGIQYTRHKGLRLVLSCQVYLKLCQTTCVVVCDPMKEYEWYEE